TSPPEMLTRPRSAGSAAVPRGRKFAVPCKLNLLLARLRSFVDWTAISSFKFCMKLPGVPEDPESPPARPAISEKSNAGENENSVKRSLPRRSADCKSFRELLAIDIGPARHFHGRDSLTLVREKFRSIDRR